MNTSQITYIKHEHLTNNYIKHEHLTNNVYIT